MPISATQVDKLGERLRTGPLVEADLRLLDEFRRSFSAASARVMATLQDDFGLHPTARPAKSTQTIVDKLLRQRTRLSQMQDIAGCRVVVKGLAEQRELSRRLVAAFPEGQLDDRVENPNHGYRAVHLIVKIDGRWVELQIRTELQQLWAAMVEKAADRVGHGIKYGVGSPALLDKLHELSELVHSFEMSDDLLLLMGPQVAVLSDQQLLKDHAEAVVINREHRRILRVHLEALAADPDNLLIPT